MSVPLHIENGFRGHSVASLPDETEGRCKKCKKFKLLGDGYCMACWDKTTGHINYGPSWKKEVDRLI